MPDHEPTPVQTGDHVQIWNSYVDAWAGDFEVVETRSDGLRVRSPGDPSRVLPHTVHRDQVRAAEPESQA